MFFENNNGDKQELSMKKRQIPSQKKYPTQKSLFGSVTSYTKYKTADELLGKTVWAGRYWFAIKCTKCITDGFQSFQYSNYVFDIRGVLLLLSEIELLALY